MHPAASLFVESWVLGETFGTVLEVGSRDINGSVRPLVDTGAYVGIDLVAGPGVDLVCDARGMVGRFDLVICCEVGEHDPDPRSLIDALGRLCKPGGRVIMTAAGPGRTPHSAVDGGPLRDGEHYENLDESYANVSWGKTLEVVVEDGDFRVVWRRDG